MVRFVDRARTWIALLALLPVVVFLHLPLRHHVLPVAASAFAGLRVARPEPPAVAEPIPMCPGASTLWEHRFDELYDTDRGARGLPAEVAAVGVGPDGNVYVTGCRGTSLETDGGPRSLMVQKLDARGEVQWSRSLVPGDGRALVIDAARHVVVAGEEHLEKGDAASTGAPGRRNWRAVVIALAESGDELWREKLADGQRVAGIALDRSQGYVVLTHDDAFEGRRGRVSWLDAYGRERATQAIGQAGAGSLVPHSLAVDGAGNVVVSGQFNRTVKCGGSMMRAPRWHTAAFVAKVSERDGVLWSRRLGSADGRWPKTRLAVDQQDHVVVLTSVDDESRGAFFVPPNLVLTTLGPDGRVLGERRFRHDVTGRGLTIDPRGHVLVSGEFAGAVDFGAGVMRGAGEGFVAAFAPDGRALYSRKTGRYDEAVAPSPFGHLVLVGNEFPDGRGAHVAALCPYLHWAAAGSATSEPPAQKRYRTIRRSFVVQRETAGVDGQVQLLTDWRVPRSRPWEVSCYHWFSGSGLGEGFDSPPLNATLQLVDESGAPINKLQFGQPLVSAETVDLYGSNKVTYSLVANDSICMGSWRWLVVTFAEVSDGRLERLVSVRPDGTHAEPMVFRVGMRGSMRTVASGKGQSRDVLYARVGFGETGQQTSYTRYSFEAGRWVRRTRVESDGTFFDEHVPPRSMFPSGGDGASSEVAVDGDPEGANRTRWTPTSS